MGHGNRGASDRKLKTADRKQKSENQLLNYNF